MNQILKTDESIRYKKPLTVFLHLLFWLVSVNAWYFVFNPGVESVGTIRLLDDFWPYLVIFNTVFFIYILLPFVWFIRKIPGWIKIGGSVILTIPVIYLLYQWIVPAGNKDDIQFFKDFFCSSFLYVVVFHLSIAGAVYFNLKVPVPRYLNQSRFGFYLFLLGGLSIVASAVNFLLFDFGIDLLLPSLYFVSYFRFWELVIIHIMYLLFSTLLYLLLRYASMLIANREKAQNELLVLKGQINPHFLFNNLNTIYSLVARKDDHAGEVILNLSEFLRYILYDTASNEIALSKEVEIIRSYIRLQEERTDPAYTKIEFRLQNEFPDLKIAPLLLLPLVENCFKHGVGREPGKIIITISTEKNRLLFETYNTIALPQTKKVENNGDIGIRNVQKRLELLYPGRHTFQYSEKEGEFLVGMTIRLNR